MLKEIIIEWLCILSMNEEAEKLVWKNIHQDDNSGYLGEGQAGESDHKELHLYVIYFHSLYMFSFLCVFVYYLSNKVLLKIKQEDGDYL